MSYTTIDDPLGVDGTSAGAIVGNDIVGTYYDSSDAPHSFLYNGSIWTTLNDPLATNGTNVYGIDGHDIVGGYFIGNDGHGFEYSLTPEPGPYALLGSLGLTGATFLRRRRIR